MAKSINHIIGATGELIAMEALLDAGATVSVPYGDGAPYDMIAEYGGRLLRIQVKARVSSANSVKYTLVNSARCTAARRYTTEEVDYFALVNITRRIVTLHPNVGHLAHWVNYKDSPTSNVAEILHSRDAE